MYELISEIVDDGEYFDIKPKFAKTIITCLARFGGQPVGIVANQPKQLGGILENDSADKAARFVNLCDAFAIPLVFLQDVPGFMVGSKVEHAGIIRHGAKMLYAISRATVPKITVVIRKAYGAGYYVMNGRAYEPDLIVAWPSAEISVMGAEGAVNIIGRSVIEAADDPDATREEMVEEVRGKIDPYIAAGNAMIDDMIDPRETRPTMIRGCGWRGQAGRAAVAQARGDAGMTVAEKVADGWNGFMGRIRHPDARWSGGAAEGFGHIRGKHGLVVSFRRAGDPVPTPVWVGDCGWLLYFRSEERVGKIKRIRPTPASSSPRAIRAASRWARRQKGRARILPAAEEATAEAAIQDNFGLGRKMYEGVAMNLGPEGVYVEVTPA